MRATQLHDLMSQAFESFTTSFLTAPSTLPAPPQFLDTYRAHVARLHRALAATLCIATLAVWVLAFAVHDTFWKSLLLKVALGPFGAMLRYTSSMLNKRPTRMCGRVACDVSTWKFPLYVRAPCCPFDVQGQPRNACCVRCDNNTHTGDRPHMPVVSFAGVCAATRSSRTLWRQLWMRC